MDNSFSYLSEGMEGARARCGTHCAFNEKVSLGEYLKSKDPTPDVQNGHYTWTKADSKKAKVNHEKLTQAWKQMQQREKVCRVDTTTPGCTALLRPTWFTDQKERIIAMLEKRLPKLNRASYDSNSVERLQKMGIKITSPIPLVTEEKPNAGSLIEIKPGSKDICFTNRKGKRILTIPVAGTDFVEIDSERDKATDEWTNVGILVSHRDGKQSYYVISSGRLIHQEREVLIVEPF